MEDRTYKQLIIEYEAMPKLLQQHLEQYEHFCSELAPYCTVTLRSAEQEQSLLEVLATIKGITYREALRREALDAHDAIDSGEGFDDK